MVNSPSYDGECSFLNDGFHVSKVVISTQDKKEDKGDGKPSRKFEGVELQALLNENDSETRK